MKYAIAELSKSLLTLIHNEPIHRAEGDIETANLEAARIVELEDAISVLKAVEGIRGFVPPAPGEPPTEFLESCGTARTPAAIVTDAPRTIRQWLETLPDGYRERALANFMRDEDYSADREKYEFESLSSALTAAFTWCETPEDHIFWGSIADDGLFPPLPEPQ